MTADTPPPSSSGGLTAGKRYRWLIALVVLLVSAEVVSRFDDWLFFGTSVFANVNRDDDLDVHDEHGIHGRPGGHFRKWRLNNFGFRAPKMSEQPKPGVTRVLILGASETFGLYEADGNEYPAQLARLLDRETGGTVEVVNVAMAGLSVRSMVPYWHKWLARLKADVVVIYPSPLFYLDVQPPTPPAETPTVKVRPWFRSRFGDRIYDTLRRFTLLRWLRQEIFARPRDDTFREVPADRLEQFTGDLKTLVETIQANGTKVVLLTHAIKVPSPPRPEDIGTLKAFQIIYPRSTPEILVAFEDAASNAERNLAQREKIPLIDAAAEFSGQEKLFADLVHFNDDGAKAFAGYLAQELLPLLPRPRDER
jgi:lysophospholipase L1-like esterase